MPDIASLFVFPFFLLFIRVGTAVMIFPGLSDLAVNVRTRLILAVMVALAMFPLLSPQLPPLPASTGQLITYVLIEMAIGLMMAISARLFVTAMHVAGELIGFTAGLHAATLFDPNSGANSTAPGLFLLVVSSVLVFATNLHHLLFAGLVDSYTFFPPGTLPPVADATEAVVRVVSDMFVVGVKLAAPVMAVGFLSYAAFGVFNRLIPQLQVFFVALPVTIYVGMIILSVAIGSMVALFSTELLNHAILFNQE